MSLTQYGEWQRKLELYGKLAAAQAHVATGDRGRPLSQVMKSLRKRLRESHQIHETSMVPGMSSDLFNAGATQRQLQRVHAARIHGVK
jgi:hypothetical protein